MNTLKQIIDHANVVDGIIQYEDGRMGIEEQVRFIGRLVRSGAIHSLQGHYQRTAASFFAAGLISSDGTVSEAKLETHLENNGWA